MKLNKSSVTWPTVLGSSIADRLCELPEPGVCHLLTKLLRVYCCEPDEHGASNASTAVGL